MSCEECEKKQNLAFDKNIPDSTPIAYYRWKNANIAIVGCKQHVKEIVEFLNRDR